MPISRALARAALGAAISASSADPADPEAISPDSPEPVVDVADPAEQVAPVAAVEAVVVAAEDSPRVAVQAAEDPAQAALQGVVAEGVDVAVQVVAQHTLCAQWPELRATERGCDRKSSPASRQPDPNSGVLYGAKLGSERTPVLTERSGTG